MTNAKPLRIAVRGYEFLNQWAGAAVLSLGLLMLRIIWGYAFFLAGKGKLGDISKPTEFFMSLNIPFPSLNAWVVGCAECFGGLLLLAGLGSRIVSIVLTCTMIVAYITADREAVMLLFSDSEPSKFMAAAPFYFLVTTLTVLALGPGWFSADALLKRFVFRKTRPTE